MFGSSRKLRWDRAANLTTNVNAGAALSVVDDSGKEMTSELPYSCSRKGVISPAFGYLDIEQSGG